ncbi:MAG: hypothetical protein LBN24_12565 [Mediterranea sp.]|jgi:hypothetical protein|nr:hypothetical protein [Mediterranea sp.]
MKRILFLCAACLTVATSLAQDEHAYTQVDEYKTVYDLPNYVKNLPVDNAYEALKELPGVTMNNGRLTLGGESVTLMLNGEVSALSSREMLAVLANTPVERVANAEVMYNASARYLVHGALININLKRGEDDTKPNLQGELYAKYSQQHYASTNERGNLFYRNKKFSADLLYGYAYQRGFDRMSYQYAWTNPYESHHYTFYSADHQRTNQHNIRLGMDYDIAKNHRLSLTYTAQSDNNHYDYQANKELRSAIQDEAYTFIDTNHNSFRYANWLHDARLDYQTPFGLKAGIEFRFVHPDVYQSMTTLTSTMQGEPTGSSSYTLYGNGYGRLWKFHVEQEHLLPRGWRLNYGAYYMLNSGADADMWLTFDEKIGGMEFST